MAYKVDTGSTGTTKFLVSVCFNCFPPWFCPLCPFLAATVQQTVSLRLFPEL